MSALRNKRWVVGSEVSRHLAKYISISHLLPVAGEGAEPSDAKGDDTWWFRQGLKARPSLAEAECLAQTLIDCVRRHESAQAAEKRRIAAGRLAHAVRTVDGGQDFRGDSLR